MILKDGGTVFKRDTSIELVAVLSSLEADLIELDALMEKLERSPEIEGATWSSSITG